MRKSVPAVMLFLALSAPRLAAQDVTDPISYRAIEDVVYGNKDGLGLTLDVLFPQEGRKNIGIIIVSSGSWRSKKPNVLEEEEKRRKRERWIQGLLKGGYTVFVVRHGSAPRYIVSEMVEDVRRSVRFVRLNVRKYEVDPALRASAYFMSPRTCSGASSSLGLNWPLPM